MKTKIYVVWPEGREAPIDALNKAHAEYIYKTYAHATLELWDIKQGTGRIIKNK